MLRLHRNCAVCNFKLQILVSYTAAPDTPEGPLEATDLTATSVTLTWKPPKSDGGQPLTGYLIECRDVRRVAWAPLATLPPNATSYTADKLLTNNDYYFRVVAQNSEGKSAPLENSKPFRPVRTPKLPSVPRGPLQVMVGGCRYIYICVYVNSPTRTKV